MTQQSSIDIASLAAAEFTRRRAVARRKAGAGDIDLRAAEALLRPWVALAIRAGADPDTLAPDGALADVEWNLEAFRRSRAVDTGLPGVTEAHARGIVADDITDFPIVRATLEAARDDAVARALGSTDAARLQRSQDLSVLAIAFGCRPYQPVQLKEAA